MTESKRRCTIITERGGLMKIYGRGWIIEPSRSLFRGYAWPSVARLPDGRLAAVFSGERMNHVCPFGKVMISYSEDEGESWTLPATLLDTPLDERDAGICVCGGNRIKTEESLSSLFLQNNQKVQQNLHLFSLCKTYRGADTRSFLRERRDFLRGDLTTVFFQVIVICLYIVKTA